MKRLFHILIPLLLSLLILISIGWYFLKYDPEFTRDLLLKQARYQDEIGNHAAAVWFYDLAYLQSDKDDAVALELAQQYTCALSCTCSDPFRFMMTKALSSSSRPSTKERFVHIRFRICKSGIIASIRNSGWVPTSPRANDGPAFFGSKRHFAARFVSSIL